MSYVGWKDMKSALRYIDSAASFAGLAVQDAAALPLTAIGRDAPDQQGDRAAEPAV
ncbi:hypothetical protein D3C78_1647720 [compost metagenome]